ncbi:phage tail protein I [Allorhizobium sp. BGMRC 0089]|uniref:phage tail protein I n=1 Tax=Allorhizobium sonneratiae TaxID=2934936 RepID=UPI0020338297|nr:phage tail protein I [Allorhizobium sonneratiae]MCM2291103.1 phage tail protein I [Allorhizobium sonneratiae]
MADLIPAALVTPGINDERARAFAATLSDILGTFQTSALLIQDPLAVDAKLLPIMTIELGMSAFMTPGLLETHVRRLLARAPDIHAMTGTVAGVRRALGALGVTVDWLQWWQKQPPGPHDTHEVTAYINEHLLDGQEALLTAETQYAVLRVIRAVQRWSQEISFTLGVGFSSSASLAADGQAATLIKPSARTVTAMPQARTGAATAAAALSVVRPSAMTVSQHPLTALAASIGLASVQLITASMEVRP